MRRRRRGRGGGNAAAAGCTSCAADFRAAATPPRIGTMALVTDWKRDKVEETSSLLGAFAFFFSSFFERERERETRGAEGRRAKLKMKETRPVSSFPIFFFSLQK